MVRTSLPMAGRLPLGTPSRLVRRAALVGAMFGGLFVASGASALTALEVNEAGFVPGKEVREGIDPAVLRAQVLLDRLRFSPGSIDGRNGDNFAKALDAFAAANGKQPAGHLTPEVWTALVATYEGPVLVPYTIADADLKGPFLKSVPKTFEDMAELDALSYTSPKEELAERFHVSPALLEALNPKSAFADPGEVIMATAGRPDPQPAAISGAPPAPGRRTFGSS